MHRIFAERENAYDNLITEFEYIRNALVKDNFFAEIKINEPNLSDHSATHIRDVLDRAYMLVGPDEMRTLSKYERI